MELTRDAAATAAQVLPVLALAIMASFAWLSKSPKIIRRRKRAKRVRAGSIKSNDDDFLDAAAWSVWLAIIAIYVLAAVDAQMMCFDVLQGNPVQADAAGFVRGTMRAGLILVFVLPVVARVVMPVLHFVINTLSARRAKRVAPAEPGKR